jgi:predicted secreted Zn-dependent protease
MAFHYCQFAGYFGSLAQRASQCLLLLATLSVQKALGAEASRSHADGPLAPADFRAAVPDPQPVKDGVRLRAMTDVEIRYTTRYRWDEPTPGKVSARLTRFDCQAVLVPGKCWNKEPDDLRLLDHEQGHFDITEINARRAQKRFEQLIADQGLIGYGSDERSAVADLDKKVHDEMQKVFDRERDEQIKYDRVTNHGRNFAAQAKQRAAIDKLLNEMDPKASTTNTKKK